MRPRQPLGGPGGGIDIDATYKLEQRAAIAISFKVDANDSAEHKRQIKKKFERDARSALSDDPKPSVFGFFTNINLTRTEKDTLKANATAITSMAGAG